MQRIDLSENSISEILPQIPKNIWKLLKFAIVFHSANFEYFQKLNPGLFKLFCAAFIYKFSSDNVTWRIYIFAPNFSI